MTNELVNRREFAPIVIPPSQALLDKIKDDLEEARELDVCSATMAEIAQELAGRISTVHDSLDAERLATTLPLREGAKWVNEGYAPTIETLAQVMVDIKAKLSAWNKKVADDRREAERVETARRKKAADEAAAVANAEKAKAEKLLADAAAAEKAGDAQVAADLFTQAAVTMDAAREQATVAAQQIVAPMKTHVGGSGVKGAGVTWKARVVNKQALVLAAANRPELMSMIDINESNLGAYARLHKGLVPMPGVEFYTEDVQRIGKRAVT
jgi:hypothetical protein